MKISVIIPTYNEEDNIGVLVNHLYNFAQSDAISEILVVDGKSEDDTRIIAEQHGAKVITTHQKGRAVQMNQGARHAKDSILYFLHADTLPPKGFDQMILRALCEGNKAGCFRLAFNDSHPLLNFYSWCTRFDIDAFRFGDQSLFIQRALFEQIGGFRNDHIVMEDNEIISRIKAVSEFKIIPESVITSARRYRDNGALRLQLIFTLIYTLYHLGIPQEGLVDIYKKFIQ